MSALRTGIAGGKAATRPGTLGLPASIDGVVLPRFLRWPVRVVGRIFAGHYAAPRYGATMASAALISASLVYGSFVGGHLPGYVQAATSRTGFAVDRVSVSGNSFTSEIDILERIGLDGWTSMIGFDAEEARQRIAGLPWVKSATVRKIYPGSIDIQLVEREPFAIWQQGSQLTVVERNGAPIVPYTPGVQPVLPLVIGFAAAEHADGFIDKVGAYPQIAGRVRAYTYVAERRWDLRLDNGITVKLPEADVDQALAELVRLDGERELLSRDIAVVDMRLDDRMVVQLTPEAAEKRQEMLAEQAKARKRAGKNI